MELGLSSEAIRHRVERGRWTSLHPEIYVIAGVPTSWRQELLGACLWARNGVASHRAAARLWRLAGFDRFPRAEITVTTAHLPPRCGIFVHFTGRLLASDLHLVEGIPTISVERTLLDLGAVVSPKKVAIALDDAVCRRLTTLERLDSYLASVAKRGRRGCGVLRRLIEQRQGSGVVPNSPLETRFFQLIAERGLEMPKLQYEIRDRGRFVARVDFAFPEERLAIEMDGYKYHSGHEAWENDRARNNRLTLLGWRVIHGTWTEAVNHPDRLLTRVETARRQHA